MPKLQDYTVYTPDNQIADLAERQGMTVHLIDGPTQHVLREAHTVYLFGSYTALRDMSETEHVTELASSLGKELLLGNGINAPPATRPSLRSRPRPFRCFIHAVPSWPSVPCRCTTCN